ncbi:MAG: IspD/TarI family cytidylyltransferase [Acidimicrobiales bacterium]
MVVAAGSGERFGGPKQYEPLGGRRVVDWSVEAAAAVCDGVVLVVPPDLSGEPEPDVAAVVGGGLTRSGSVRAGLAAVPADADVIVVHDAARPLASVRLWETIVASVAVGGSDAAIPVVAVRDTLREVGGGTVDRARFVVVQTPQAFRADLLRRAHEGDPEATDDAALVEAIGGKVITIEGEPGNLKVTTPGDLDIAAALLP